MKDKEIELGEVETMIRGMEDEGKTAMLMAVDRSLEAVIAVADTLKEHALEAISEFNQMGLEVYMITGDNLRTARAIAAQVGISQVLAEVLPENKAEEILKLKEAGKVVAMVGADITLMRGDLRAVSAAIRLSRKTIIKIKQNLFWAFIYNIIGIPFAALGFLNPIIAGGAMAFSSVSVVTNSLSLKRFAP